MLHLPMRAAGTAERISFVGDRWRLTVDGGVGWRRQKEETTTLTLMRQAEGVKVVLRLRVYGIRDGMPPKTFLAAHAMWLAEEGGPRIEYTWDKDLQAWQGYAVDRDRETYYVFRVVADRAYVLEASAEAGSLSARAADEFQRIAADFECRPAPGQAALPPSPETQPETP